MLLKSVIKMKGNCGNDVNFIKDRWLVLTVFADNRQTQHFHII